MADFGGSRIFYEACFYLTQYSASQELFIIFMARWCRKGYNNKKFPQNSSPVGRK